MRLRTVLIVTLSLVGSFAAPKGFAAGDPWEFTACDRRNPNAITVEQAIAGCSEVFRRWPGPQWQVWALSQRALHNESYGPSGYQSALADLNLAINISPSWPLYKMRATARGGLGDYDGAIADLNTAIALQPADWTLRSDRGMLRAQSGDLAGALAEFDELIRNGSQVFGLFGRCQARMMHKNDLEKALADCAEVEKIQGPTARLVGVRATMGWIHFAQHRWDAAIADFDADMTQVMNPGELLLGRGLAKKAKGDMAGGNADVAAALARNPNVKEPFAELSKAVMFKF